MGGLSAVLVLVSAQLTLAQSTSTAPADTPRSAVMPAPDRKPGEGEGPFPTLVIRGVTLIDGTVHRHEDLSMLSLRETGSPKFCLLEHRADRPAQTGHQQARRVKSTPRGSSCFLDLSIRMSTVAAPKKCPTCRMSTSYGSRMASLLYVAFRSRPTRLRYRRKREALPTRSSLQGSSIIR